MDKAKEAGAYITRLSAKHGIDPFMVTGLLAIHALCDVDFGGIAFWKQVSEAMRPTAA